MNARLLLLAGTVLLGTGAPAGAAEGADRAGQKPELLWRKLEAAVKQVDAELDGVLGVAILDLTDGRTLLLNGDEVFAAASSIKIAVLADLYRQTDEAAGGAKGRATLTDPYTVNAADLVDDSRILAGLSPGLSRVTNRDLATFMVAVSDNAATNVLIDRLGTDRVNALLEGLGLREMRLRRKMMDVKAAAEGRENTATPREMAHLLESLFRGKVLGPASTEDFFRLLKTRKPSYIPLELPEEVAVANKPGELEAVRNDSGIVYAPGHPFVISVMTGYLADERAGERAIGRIAAAAYRCFERLGRSSPYGRTLPLPGTR